MPEVSILICVHGKLELTRRCLDAIAATAPAGRYEVVVVDNASPDGSGDALEALRESYPAPLKVIRSDENLGFVGGNNLAAAARDRRATSLLLNNDTEPQPGLVRGAARDRRARPVGRRRRREARLPGRTAPGGRRDRLRRRIRLELRPRRRSRRSALRLRPRGRLLLGRVPARAARSLVRARRLRRALRAGLLRGHRPLLRRPRARPEGRLPARRRDRPPRGRDGRHRHRERLQAAPGREPRALPRQVGRRRCAPSSRRTRRSSGARATASPASGSSSSTRLMPMYDRASGSRRLHELLLLLASAGHAVTFVARECSGEDRYRGPLEAGRRSRCTTATPTACRSRSAPGGSTCRASSPRRATTSRSSASTTSPPSTCRSCASTRRSRASSSTRSTCTTSARSARRR